MKAIHNHKMMSLGLNKIILNKIILFLILFFSSSYAVSQPWGESGMGGDFVFFAQRVNSQGIPSAPQIISEEELIQERGYLVDKVVARATPSATKRPRAAAAAAMEEAEEGASAVAAAAPAPSRSRRSGGGGAAAVEEDIGAAAAAAAPAPAPSRSRRSGGGGAAAAAVEEVEEMSASGDGSAATTHSRSSGSKRQVGGRRVEMTKEEGTGGGTAMITEPPYLITPHEGIGMLRLGMDTHTVSNVMKLNGYHKIGSGPDDTYYHDTLHYCFKVDKNVDGFCSFIQAFSPTPVLYKGKSILEMRAGSVIKLLSKYDPTPIEIDGLSGTTFLTLCLTCFIPGLDTDLLEGIGLFEKGYYDELL